VKHGVTHLYLALCLLVVLGTAAAHPTATSRSVVAKACGPERVRVRSGDSTQCIGVWRYLRRRPVRVPSLVPGAPCPADRPRGDLAVLATGIVGTAFGPGPVYPGLGSAQERAEFSFYYPPPRTSGDYGSEWSGQKVMWILRRGFAGPALVRGRQLDGPNELRFDLGLVPSPERRLRGSGGHASSTRLRAPGCYAYQVDGLRFSYRIVFEAKLYPS